MDCFVAPLLAMTNKELPNQPWAKSQYSFRARL